MKRIEKTLLHGSGYTVLILTLFYAFAHIAEFDKTSIGIGRFFIVLGFSMLIACAELLYELLSVKRWLKNLIHYFILLSAFSIIFIFGDFYTAKGITAVFISIILFTILYLLILGIVLGVRRTVNVADRKIDKRINSQSCKSGAKDVYTPKFK